MKVRVLFDKKKKKSILCLIFKNFKYVMDLFNTKLKVRKFYLIFSKVHGPLRYQIECLEIY